jgi:hypothetical protein
MSAAADKAVKHLLDRAQTDPDFGYLVCPLTESFALLCAAEAERTGEMVEAVRQRRSVDLQPKYRRREPEVVRLEKLLDRYEAKFGELEEES